MLITALQAALIEGRDNHERHRLLVETCASKRPSWVTLQNVTAADDLEEAFAQVGLGHWTYNSTSRLAIASRYQLTPPPQHMNSHPFILARRVNIAEKHFLIGSVTLKSGLSEESTRLLQASLLTTAAQQNQERYPTTPFLVGGEWNSRETARTVRFLNGLDVGSEGESTFWEVLSKSKWRKSLGVPHNVRTLHSANKNTHSSILLHGSLDYWQGVRVGAGNLHHASKEPFSVSALWTQVCF